MRILVVDDSATMRRIIENNLRTSGFEDIVQASNGLEALSSMAGVELVLTDWNMPVMDGLSLVKELRGNPAFGSVPIVMVTTEGAKDEVIEALKQGVNDYIVKPFTKQTLLEKIEKVLKG